MNSTIHIGYKFQIWEYVGPGRLQLPSRDLWPLHSRIRIPRLKRLVAEWGSDILPRLNTLTNYGLSQLSASSPATFLVIDSSFATLTQAQNPGDLLIVPTIDPTVSGDTQLVVGVGLASQETVTFTAKSGAGPVTFTLASGLVNFHNTGEYVVRPVSINDSLASVLSEAQYDPTFFPNLRVPLTSSFSPNVGQTVYQFFISGIQATNLYFAHVGLADNPTIGQGNLHNYSVLGYNHNNTNDTEIDALYTLSGG